MPKKCQIFATEVKWCGRIISAEGVKHCPDRVQGLIDMQPPQTAAELQQYLCATNWMRQSTQEYTRIAAPLYSTLERAAKIAGSRKNKLVKVRLSDAEWSDKDVATFGDVRRALLKMVPLDYPKPTTELCLHTDASQDFLGAVVTQL